MTEFSALKIDGSGMAEKEQIALGENRIIEGDRVLFYLDARRTWLIQVKNDSPAFHTHAGIIQVSEAIGKDYGSSLPTTLGSDIFLLRPVTLDYVMKSERKTQIVYPKDFAYIAARAGLRSGCKVFECGTGSGALTAFFASIVAPSGLVHTFEQREDFLTIAKKNVAKAGLSPFVRFENNNPLSIPPEGFERNSYDLALLDTGDPWTLLTTIHPLLKGSGFVFSICPTMNQVEEFVESMHGRFTDIECVEIMLRRIEARRGKTRPSMRMIGHTCYLASGRKIEAKRAEPQAVANSYNG
jgi:tRNA (adenine57-N1/adenine58-N1)-methyltransferase